jgi:hypothetical protein
MAHPVFVVDTVARVAASLSKPDRRAYDAAISGLKGEGCKAAGYRLAASDGHDFPMCCRHLANDWRMHTLFANDGSVIVISLATHDRRQNPHQILAEIFPELSSVGRRKRTKPPCCDDPERPPVMPVTVSEQLARLAGYSDS